MSTKLPTRIEFEGILRNTIAGFAKPGKDFLPTLEMGRRFNHLTGIVRNGGTPTDYHFLREIAVSPSKEVCAFSDDWVIKFCIDPAIVASEQALLKRAETAGVKSLFLDTIYIPLPADSKMYSDVIKPSGNIPYNDKGKALHSHIAFQRRAYVLPDNALLMTDEERDDRITPYLWEQVKAAGILSREWWHYAFKNRKPDPIPQFLDFIAGEPGMNLGLNDLGIIEEMPYIIDPLSPERDA